METPDELRAKAARYRDMERDVTDRQLRDALVELADKYEALAAKLEREAWQDNSDQAR